MRTTHQCTFINHANNNKIFYITTNPNQKADYLLLHGYKSSSLSSETLSKIMNKIAIKDPLAIISSMDYYGHGKTHGKIENFTITKGYSDVQSMIANNCKNTCKIIGNSMGGLLAFIASYKIGNHAICIAPPIYCLDKQAATKIGHNAFAMRLGDDATNDMFTNWISNISENSVDLNGKNAILFYGMNDDIVDPYISLQSAYKISMPPKIILYPNASHNNHTDKVIDCIGSYI